MGNMTYTANLEGSSVLTYQYLKDDDGRYILDKTVSHTGDTTYFKDGKQQYTINDKGTKTIEYFWDGSQLTYSFDYGIEETTYYDINGKEQYTTHNENMIKQWLYHKGGLVGFYDGNNERTILYQYQREDVTVATKECPTAELIQKWYNDGLIEKRRNYAAN